MVDPMAQLADVPVAEVLTGTLRIVHASMSMRAAAETMAEDGIGLLVVANPDGRLAGVVSERDLVHVVAAAGDVDGDRVADRMADDVVTIDRDADVATAARTMARADIRHLVVVDSEGSPIGVVSVRDVLRSLVDGSAHTEQLPT